MGNCKKCNKEIESRFCPHCGYDNGDKGICPICGAEMSGRFCGQCGYDSQKRRGGEMWSRFCEFLKKNKKPILIISLSILAAILITTLCIIYFSNIFRIGKVSKIEIGMSMSQVKEILGEPSEESERGNELYWYEDAITERIEKAEKILMDSFESEDEEQIEAAILEYDRLYAEIEKMTFKCITVSFNGEEKVTKVFFNRESKYDAPLSSYKKDFDEATLNVSSLSGSFITVDDKTHFELNDTTSEYAYSVVYKDGSYYLSKISAGALTIEKAEEDFYVYWEDILGKYKTKKVVILDSEYVIKDGVLESYKSNQETFRISNTVTEIGKNAFNDNKSLKKLIIPNSVQIIRNGAFKGCSNLEFNEFENALYLGNEDNPYLVLYKATSTEIRSCKINSNTKIICGSAFFNCDHLSKIVIPDGVITIGDYAFSNCSYLNAIDIPDSILNINPLTFDDKIKFSYNGLTLSRKDNSFSVVSYRGDDASLTIPSKIIGLNVTSIGDMAFRNCDSLASVTIGNGVTSIGSYAFRDCDSLASVTIGNGVTSIGSYAFRDCDSLASVTIGNGVTSIGSDAFYSCDSLTEVHISDIASWCNISFGNYYSNPLSLAENLYINNELVTNLTIPDTVTKINNYAFRSCTYLTSVLIGNGVTSIGEDAFSSCTSLTSVTIGDSVTSIGYGAFGNCTSLKYNEYDNGYYLGNEENPYVVLVKAKDESITSCAIHENTKCIHSNAFSGCSKLTSITIPNSVTSIGKYAFWGCDSLTSVTIGSGVTSIGEDAFSSCTSLKEVYISDIASWCNISFRGYESNPLYYAKNLYINNELVTNLVIPNTVTKINNFTFYNCDSLTSITIPNSVTSIGNSAFSGCDELTSITIPSSVTSIGNSAFSGCDSLVSVAIPNSVTSIGSCAFENCKSLTNISIPNSITIIENSVFKYCSSLTNITIPNSVTCIDSYAFFACNDLNISFEEGSACKSIEGCAFAWCGFESITIPNSVTSIGSGAFEYCLSLKKITIPASATNIYYDAFFCCERLTNIIVDENNTNYKSIDGNLYTKDGKTLIQYAIGKLDESFEISNFVTHIGRNAFYGCKNLLRVIVPNCVTSIESNAFAWSGNLNIYCEATSKPTNWSENWDSNTSSNAVYWYSENEPTSEGYYWHYVDGEVVAWR